MGEKPVASKKHPDNKLMSQENGSIKPSQFRFEDLLSPEDMEQLPPDAVKKIRSSFSRFSMMVEMGRARNPIAEKIEPKHITSIIKNADEASNREYKDRKSIRSYIVIYSIIGIVAFGLFTYFLVNKDSVIYFEAIKILGAILGGFLGGLGFGYYKGKKKND